MKISKILGLSFVVAVAVLLTLFLIGTLGSRRVPIVTKKSHVIPQKLSYSMAQDANGNVVSLAKPQIFSGLAPRTPLTFTTGIYAMPSDNLYVKAVYTPLRVFANDELLYESGQDGSYPRFMLDPPTIIATVPLGIFVSDGGMIKLRFEYLSPRERDSFIIHPIAINTEATLISRLFEQFGFSFVFSLILIFVGTLMVLVSFAFLRTERSMISFLWLGLFVLLSGVWAFGECNLTVFFVPYPSLLYFLAFMGLFTFAIPLLMFGLSTMELKYKLPLKIMLALLCSSVVAALILQMGGVVGFARSVYVFHIIVPLSVLIFASSAAFEAFKLGNQTARRFFFPMFVIALSLVFELVNFYVRFTSVMSLLFQIGMLVLMAIESGYLSRDTIRTWKEKTRLEYEVGFIGQQLETQRTQYALLARNAESVKAQHHDMRHQLAVIKHYSGSGDIKKLDDYIDELILKIPTDKDIILCENWAVNAVALYYVTAAKNDGVDVSAKLTIAEKNGRVSDSDLCIIVGNLLENAFHACKLMTHGERFIKMNSRLQYETLTITMDNSFLGKNGTQEMRREGIGLPSIRAVAEKYGGSALFEEKGGIFQSSVYINLG